MRLAELAIALSARDWAEKLHRFLADHGGARVRVNAFGPDDLFREAFDVLLIDDSCSFISPRLVADVTRLGRRVIGVFDPSEFPDGKDRLRESGVGDVIEADASPEEFVALISRVSAELDGPAGGTETVGTLPGGAARDGARTPALTVVGAGGGVGVTEVALAMAAWLASRRFDVVVIDGDRLRPAIAQRLGLHIHPNLMTVLDRIDQDRAPFEGVTQLTAAGFSVIPGSASTRSDASVTGRVVDEARGAFDAVIVDAGAWTTASRVGGSDRDERDRTVVVGGASPVGLTRLLDAAGELGSGALDLVVNRVPSGRFRRSELAEELLRAHRPRSLGLLPSDEAVERAAWSGRPVGSGRFQKSVDRWLQQVWGR